MSNRLRAPLLSSIAIIGLTLGLAGCAPGESATPDEAEGTIKLVYSYEPNSLSSIMQVALDQGFFEEEGLDVEFVPGVNLAQALTQTVSGQLNVAAGGFSASIAARASGIPIRVVSKLASDHEDPLGAQYGTITRADSGIDGFEDLTGKKVAVNSLNCCWQFWTATAVDLAGGDGDSVEFLQVPFPNQLEALRTGQVDAITTLQPFLVAAGKEGMVNIGNPAAIALDDPEGAGLLASMAEPFIAEHPDVVERWQRAIAKAADYANSHPDEMRQIISEATGIPIEVLNGSPLPKYTATTTEAVAQKEIDFMVDFGVIPEDDAPTVDELLAPGAAE